MCGRRTVENVSHSEQKFLLESLAADAAALFHTGALGDVEKSETQATRIKALEMELKEVNRECVVGSRLK